MADFRISTQTPGLKEAVANYDSLDKAQQRAFRSALGLDKAQMDLGKKTKEASKEGVVALQDLAKTIVGVGSATAVATKVLAALREEYERVQQRAKAFADTQRTFAAAEGALLANNPLLGKPDLQRIRQFALQQGAQGGGSPAEVLAAVTAVRSQMGNVAVEPQLQAVEAAVRQKRIDPSTDLSSFATALLRTQTSLNLTGKQAANVVSVYGQRAGGDIAQLAGTFGPLAGTAAGTKAGLTDVLALHGWLTQTMGDATGEESATVVASALGRLKSRPIRIPGRGGGVVKFKSENEVDRLLELSQRLQAGEFKGHEYAIMRQVLQGAQAPKVFGALAAGAGGLQETRGLLRQAVGGNVDYQAQALALRSGTAQDIEQMQVHEGAFARQQILDEAMGRLHRQMNRLQLEREQANLGFLGDPFGGVREAAVNAGVISAGTASAMTRAQEQQAIQIGAYRVDPMFAAILGPIMTMLDQWNKESQRSLREGAREAVGVHINNEPD